MVQTHVLSNLGIVFTGIISRSGEVVILLNTDKKWTKLAKMSHWTGQVLMRGGGIKNMISSNFSVGDIIMGLISGYR